MYKEDERIELKKSLSQLKEGIISLSSMLNKHGEGNVYFGINDDGKVVGLEIGKKTIGDITHEIQNNLKPIPNNVEIKQLVVEEKNIILVRIKGNDTPYSAYGRYYNRINDADIQMSNTELSRYFEKKDDTYFRWEKRETSYSENDIDENLLIDCIRTSNDNGRLNYVYRNANEALEKLGLLCSDGKINNAGVYLFGKCKPITIKLGKFPTDSRTDFGEIKEFSGNIFECINEVIAYIKNGITYKSNIIGFQREDVPEIPIKALREIIVNSFAHCNYEKIGDYNSYVIYKSSVRIYNPGPIINNINPMRFASGEVGSKIRNVLIASCLYKCGYIDAFGTGFDRTFSLCINQGVNYHYENNEFGFTFVFDRNENILNNNEIYKDISIIQKRSTEELIIYHVKNNKYVTIPELAKLIEKSEPTIHRSLEKLMKDKMIERVGSRKNGYWRII